MRVTVDGTTHPIHDDVPSLSVTLADGDEIAEVQVADIGGTALNLVIAGQVIITRDARGKGFHMLQVLPTPKEG